MALEIERKFLVKRDLLPTLIDPIPIQQAYIPTSNGTTVRVRLAGNVAMLTIKTRTISISRNEYEFPIPVTDARELIEKACHANLVEKHRHLVRHGGLIWEIDIFSGLNEGLIVAEIELEQEDQEFDLPDWAAEEVSDDSRYSNSNLAIFPYSSWAR